MATDLQSAPFGHLGTCPKHPAHYTANPSTQIITALFFIRMMKKEDAGWSAHSSPFLTNKDESVSWGHSLVQETLDSIDEVWRCQDPKAELSCFFSDSPYLPKFSCAPPMRPHLFYVCLSRCHIARTKLASPKHLTDISWAYGDRSFSIRTDRIVQPLGLNQKVPPSHAIGGWEKIQLHPS